MDDGLPDRALALARQRLPVLAPARLLPRSPRAARPRHPHRHRRRAPPARPRDRRRAGARRGVEAVVYVFGALLLYVAYRALRGADEASDPAANPVLDSSGAWSRRPTIPWAGGCSSAKPAVSTAPRCCSWSAVIAADIAFAVDSIPAAFAVTRDPVVIWTANAFALLGLGSLLALVDILVRRFRYVDETIALILAFVGIKILAPTSSRSATSAHLPSSPRSLRVASPPRSLRIVSSRPSRSRQRGRRPDARPRSLTDAQTLSRNVSLEIERWRPARTWIRSG